MTADLADAPGRLSFYQFVRLVEARAGRAGIVGALGPVRDEPLLFRAQLGLGFPAAELGRMDLRPAIDSLGPETTDTKIELEVTFLGLYGAASPLPADVTERLLYYDDTGTTRDFLDIFNHRLIALLYRIWRRYRVELERNVGIDDVFSTVVGCIAGFMPDAAPSHIDKGALLGSLRHLVGWTHSAQDLRLVLSQQFPGVAFSIQEFVLREFEIDPEDQWSLGRGALGEDIVLGDRMPDVASRIHIYVQTPDWPTYLQFLPSGERFGALVEMIRYLLREQLDVIILPSVPAAAIQETRLNAAHQALGLSTWLGQPPNPQIAWPGFSAFRE